MLSALDASQPLSIRLEAQADKCRGDRRSFSAASQTSLPTRASDCESSWQRPIPPHVALVTSPTTRIDRRQNVTPEFLE